MDWKKEITDTIKGMAGSYSSRDIFTDWVCLMALSIQNGCTLPAGRIYRDREKQYADIMKKYGGRERQFGEMQGMLCLYMEEKGLWDVLGEIYMELEAGSRAAGQFFTPFHLSRLCAEMAAVDSEDGRAVTIYEPSCGSAGMVIAAAAALEKRGIDYQKRMKVLCQDLDWRCVYMAYVQLSLYGIDAAVAQGDSLKEPFGGQKTYLQYRVFSTPRRAGLLL